MKLVNPNKLNLPAFAWPFFLQIKRSPTGSFQKSGALNVYLTAWDPLHKHSNIGPQNIRSSRGVLPRISSKHAYYVNPKPL